MIVTLTPQDALVAASVGMRRQLYAMARRLPNYGEVDERHAFDFHIFGAMAEFAVARTLNLFWEANVGNTRAADVGGAIDVRMRRIPGTGTDLAIHPDDKDGRPYVLVHNRGDLSFDLKGWVYGKEGKGRGPFNDQKQCWFVPPPYRPIEQLIAMYGCTPEQEAQAS